MSNRRENEGTVEKDKQSKQSKAAAPKTAKAAIGRAKRGRDEASKATENKLSRRASSRGGSQKEVEEIAGDNISFKKEGGLKHATDKNSSQTNGRGTKRAKTSNPKHETLSVGNRRAIRAYSPSQNAKPVIRRRNTNKAAEERQETVNIVTDEHHLVPPDFRLKRNSFNGQNYTYGIAHYDAVERSDPFLCKDYVTDMFQYLYYSEVGSCYVVETVMLNG